MRKHAITIVDVAKAARVSVSTVSRVLNEKDDVSEETYKRVREVIAELGYSSSLAAKSMRSRKTNVIGLIMPDVEFPFAIEVMKGVNRGIVEANYDLLVFTNGDIRRDASGIKEQQYVSLLNNSVTDGVIIVTPMTGNFFSTSPVVAIDPNINSSEIYSVVATNYDGAVEATEYLIELGHKRIGYIGGRSELQSAFQRQKAFEETLKTAGLPVQRDLIKSGDYSTETSKKIAKQMLLLENPPTAIFASNDQSAIGVIQAADELDIDIPGELSLIGFDNISEAAHHNLTTVDQFIAEMGYMATQMLFTLIDGKEIQSDTMVIKTKLIERGSCAKAP
ncbi:MAG: LacI family DNA-binding transcriptional regulator [Anaerolineales bacterium]|nr:LacI family DNA-binding transcriptional regulator [Anaerolineales bacterium]